MNEWHDYFVATAGASAALTGLIFVGVSINLTRILSTPTLPGRAFISMMLLLTILIVSLFLLVPYKSNRTPGVEIFFVGIIIWAFVLYADIRIIRNKEHQYRRLYILNLSMNQVAVLPYWIGAAFLLTDNESGIFWIHAAIAISFIKASLDAWVLLIEINR